MSKYIVNVEFSYDDVIENDAEKVCKSVAMYYRNLLDDKNFDPDDEHERCVYNMRYHKFKMFAWSCRVNRGVHVSEFNQMMEAFENESRTWSMYV